MTMATDFAKFRLDGGKTLDRQLGKLDTRMAGKILKSATRKAAKPITANARRKVPTETGLLKISLGVKVKAYKRSGTVAAIIGPRTEFKSKKATAIKGGLSGQRAKRKPANYAHLVEWGVTPHTIATRNPMTLPGGTMTRFVSHPGIRATRFMSRAFSRGQQGRAIRIMSDVIRFELNRATA